MTAAAEPPQPPPAAAAGGSAVDAEPESAAGALVDHGWALDSARASSLGRGERSIDDSMIGMPSGMLAPGRLDSMPEISRWPHTQRQRSFRQRSRSIGFGSTALNGPGCIRPAQNPQHEYFMQKVQVGKIKTTNVQRTFTFKGPGAPELQWSASLRSSRGFSRPASSSSIMRPSSSVEALRSIGLSPISVETLQSFGLSPTIGLTPSRASSVTLPQFSQTASRSTSRLPTPPAGIDALLFPSQEPWRRSTKSWSRRSAAESRESWSRPASRGSLVGSLPSRPGSRGSLLGALDRAGSLDYNAPVQPHHMPHVAARPERPGAM